MADTTRDIWNDNDGEEEKKPRRKLRGFLLFLLTLVAVLGVVMFAAYRDGTGFDVLRRYLNYGGAEKAGSEAVYNFDASSSNRFAVLGDRLGDPFLAAGGGYDQNFVLDGGEGPAAELYCPRTGIAMEMTTTLEGTQLYTAGHLSNRPGKGGAVYDIAHAVCLETQHFPDAVNHANFPSPILRAGQEFHETTSYRFFVK